MDKITKIEYKLLKLLDEGQRVSPEIVAEKLNISEFQVDMIVMKLRQDGLAIKDQIPKIYIDGKGVVAIKDYEENQRLQFFKNFVYPVIVALVGVIVGAIIAA